MDVLTLSNTSFTGLSSNYIYDSNLEIKTDTFTSYEGITLPVIEGLSGSKDTSNNWYSSFVLTDKININDAIKVKSVTPTYPYSYTTYLALFISGPILPDARVVTTILNNQTSTAYKISFSFYGDNLDTQNYTINFHDINFCTVTQVINSHTYYLTYFQCNSGSSQFLMVSSYQNDEANLFGYVYDEITSQILLTKLVNGLQSYVGYDTGNGYLSMFDYVTGGDQFVITSAFKIREKNNLLPTLPSDWYSYVKVIDVDGLDVNIDRTVEDVDLNYLFNVTNEKLSANALPINLIPLKSDKDDKNSLSRGSIINKNVKGVIQRNYNSLNTGTTQIKGSPDFNLTYNSYTTQLLVPTDNTTFFYFPYEPFPVIKLNINDSSLVESGAIAGDSPYNADKVFKHKVKESFDLPYNTNNTEQTGTYLCSWLKGGTELSSLPVWVDRYYNPSIINSIGALQYNTNSNYVTEFSILSGVNPDNIQYPVYDIVSNLTFEPGYQYAIQHLGYNNIVELINSLSANIVQKYLNNKYDYLNQYFEYDGNEITLGGKYYSKFLTSQQIAEVGEFNNFTLNFDLYVNDWSKPIGYQILGNYNNSNFGIFNYQQVTPFVITYDATTIYVYNTDLKLLDSINLQTNITRVIKLDPVGNILAITDDNYITRINYNSVITDKKQIPNLSQYSSFYSTLEYTYCFTLGLPIVKISNSSLEYEIDSSTIVSIVIPNYIPTSYSILVLNDIVYIVPGFNIKTMNGDIYFTIQNGTVQSLCVYNRSKASTTVIYASTTINDYILNDDNSIYLLFNNNQLLLSDSFYRIKTDNNFPIKIFNNIPTLSAVSFYGMDYIREFDGTGVTGEGICFVGYDNSTSTKYLVKTNKIVDGSLVEVQQTNSMVTSVVGGVRNITNYNFNNSNLTGAGKLEFRLSLPNIYDKIDTKLIRFIYDVSGLESGFHNFVVRFDSINGVFTVFVDGVNVYQTLVQGGQYSFSELLNRDFFVGNCIYYNNQSLGDYTLHPYNYFTRQIDIKNFYLYKVALSYYDIILHLKLNYPISDLRFQLPTGKRNYLETIQQFFKFKVPGFKSNYFNVNVVDLPIGTALKQQVDNTFIQILNKNKPGYTELNNINYNE